jgi:hypothetical protein
MNIAKAKLGKTLSSLPLRLAIGITTLSSIVLLHPNIAHADRFTDQVGAQLLLALRGAGLAGYHPTHEPFISEIGNGGYDDIEVNLQKGQSYAMTGSCDQDCGDLDLEIYDDNGNLIDSDIELDDFPILSVQPRWNAHFTIRAKMEHCSNAPCRYGIGIFGK